MKPSIVLDTNVLVSALKSSRSASFRLLSMVEHGHFVLHVSTAHVTEYEAVLKRGRTALSTEDIDNVVDFICSVAVRNKIFYLWRPALKDPSDDFVLELAVKANATIVTWNVTGFKRAAAHYGVAVLTPRDFLASLKVQL